MSSSALRELEAQIAEMEAKLHGASPEIAGQLRQSIESLRQVAQMSGRLQPAMDEMAAHRPALSEEARAFFTPEPPAPVPAWIPDSLTRAEADEAMMRCPPGARVYAFESSLSCSIPGVPGQSLSIAHGLDLGFSSSGRLAHQRYYELGLCRWSIDYHLNGRRSQAGFYADREESEYRRDGLHTSWSMDGVVKVQTAWAAGVHHGWTRHWEDDGFPVGATRYENGEPVEQVNADGSRLPL